MNKPKIFCFGACDLWDSVDIDIIRKEFELDRYYFRKSYYLNRKHNQFLVKNDPEIVIEDPNEFYILDINPPPLSTSLLSMYTPAGTIADQMLDLIKITNKKVKHKGFSTDIYSDYFSLYQEIAKWPWIENYRDCVGPDDFLVLNFSSELYSKFVKKETITLIPALVNHLEYPELAWLKKELYNEDFHRSFDQEDILGPTLELVKEFARDLLPIFGNRIILVDTLLTDFVYSNDLNDIKKIKTSCTQIPFYKPTKITADPTDKSHVRRLLNLATRGFQRSYKYDVPFVTLDSKDCFLDPLHRYGPSPFHLHRQTTEKLGNKIYQEIKKIQGVNNGNRSVII
jgi:hypothetical protein